MSKEKPNPIVETDGTMKVAAANGDVVAVKVTNRRSKRAQDRMERKARRKASGEAGTGSEAIPTNVRQSKRPQRETPSTE